MRRVMTAMIAGLLLAGCTSAGEGVVVEAETEVEPPPVVVDPPRPPADIPEPPNPGAPPDDGGPPDLRVTAGEATVDVRPFTWCWTTLDAGVCADGIPQPEHVVLDVPGALEVQFLDGELTAMAGPLDGGDRQPLPVTAGPVTDGTATWQVDVSGLASGDHPVTLAWNGDEGDVHGALTVRRR